MDITVFGTGYVGLVTGACLADVGHNVLCMDVDSLKISRLKLAEVTIFEPGLDEVVRHNLASGNLSFTDDVAEAIKFSSLFIIAVGTPSLDSGEPDLSGVDAVAQDIGRLASTPLTLVTKSTVPVGTSERIGAIVSREAQARGKTLEIQLVSNPEFLKEGAAVGDFMKPDRIVIGAHSETAKATMRKLYAPFNRNHDRILCMDLSAAELTKYAANAMLATKISFINEIANLAEKVGADIEQVRQGIGSDPRIGYQFIYAGCGYGGSCFPKDVRALCTTAKEYGVELGVISAVEAANERQKNRLFDMLTAHFGIELHGKTIALWGLAFKPKTDDLREAPSRVLMEALWQAGAIVQAYDPEAMHAVEALYPDNPQLILAGTMDQALVGADALVICTEWQHFKAPNLDKFKKALSQPVIFDGRNLYDPAELRERGIRYFGIGRGESLNRT
jgi:UDPglucose 6-dehydrogenase